MAIGISGTNSNVSSVEVSVGPGPWNHQIPTIPYRTRLASCIDAGNRKCYSGNGSTARDFVAEVNLTLYNGVSYLNDNVGCFQLTAGAYLESSQSYSFDGSASSYPGFTIDAWIYPSSGLTQDETILAFREISGTDTINGIVIRRRKLQTSDTAIAIDFYHDDPDDRTRIATTTLQGALIENSWNNITFYDTRISSEESFRIYSGRVIAGQIPITTSGNYSIIRSSFYNDDTARTLSIGKAEGITGTFRGKIGLCRIYDHPVFTEEPSGSEIFPWDKNYAVFSPRYDQYL